ncbi:MAG: hypothetical protein FWB96_03615 [Defluviitaleaceae bacterium]|nr:hypothetical protein [Defluviitaleaceae bacterium]MCL2262160.1 hypothetical protein [Defluviitaleaceae bacterium]
MAVEKSAGKGKKAAVVKSKISKPNPKQKQVQYRIEVSSAAVKVLRVDAKGKIIGNGIAQLEGEPIWADKSWIGRLSQSIRNAARDAKVPKGAGFACSVVAGGPQIIVQRFTWPEFNHAAMLENAKHEIASYLPGTPSGFVISAEVQRRNEAAEGKAATLDVFVAAMPKDMATAISSAVNWAGFKVVNLDVSENVRGRLVKKCCIVDGSAPQSFGILDLSSAMPNITLYLDGFFYSTQYFSAVQTASGVATLDEMEAQKDSNAPPVLEFNVEAILSEISFVTDFIKYQERADIDAILVLGATKAGFTDRLSSGLSIPVYSTDVWMLSGIADSISDDKGTYLDAYAAGIHSSIIGAQHMLNVKTPPIIRNPKARLTGYAAACAVVIFGMLALGMFIPYIREQALRREYRAMDGEANRVLAFVAGSPTVHMVEELGSRIDFIETRVDGIDDFYAEFAQAAVVVPEIFEAGFSHIQTINANEDRVTIRAHAAYYSHLADLLEHFRDHELFRDSGVVGNVVESDTTDWIYGTTAFEARLIMERRAGAINE